MAVLNSNILTSAWLSGSNMFQQRIPNPAQASYANVVSNLFAPMNHDMFNEFSHLLNGLNATYVDSKRWLHGLRALKKPASEWGNTERHVAIKYLKAKAGRYDDETLLKVEKPEFVEWFHSVGEPRRYEFSWSKAELARVFSADGYGYDDLLQGTITQMLNSAELDEMNIMVQMFAEADKRMGGLYRYNLDSPVTDRASAEQLIVGVRSLAKRMTIAPTMQFNKIGIPVTESPQTLIFWCTPEVSAVVDVAFLSSVFNLSKADIDYKMIVIPEFPLPNVQAALTSEDFIYYRDFMTGLEPPFYNPGNRTLKYYYWANAMIGINPAANCVLFTTEPATVIPTITVTPSALNFDQAVYTAAAGESVELSLTLDGTVSGDGNTDGLIKVKPKASMFTVSSPTAALNSRTYVDSYGILHLQKSGLSVGDEINVKAVSTYINPSGETNEMSATCTVEIVASEPESDCAKPFIVYSQTPDKDVDEPAQNTSPADPDEPVVDPQA